VSIGLAGPAARVKGRDCTDALRGGQGNRTGPSRCQRSPRCRPGQPAPADRA